MSGTYIHYCVPHRADLRVRPETSSTGIHTYLHNLVCISQSMVNIVLLIQLKGFVLELTANQKSFSCRICVLDLFGPTSCSSVGKREVCKWSVAINISHLNSNIVFKCIRNSPSRLGVNYFLISASHIRDLFYYFLFADVMRCIQKII